MPLSQKKNETILVVDDEEMVRNFVCAILKQQGYQVHAARNGEEAFQLVSLLGRGDIQLLFTDVVMPKMGGKNLANALKAFQPKMKVLYASGYSDGDLRESGSIDANIHFIQKPYSAVDLTSKIRQILDDK